MWEKWYKTEEVYIAKNSPKEFANLVLDGTKAFEEQLSTKDNA